MTRSRLHYLPARLVLSALLAGCGGIGISSAPVGSAIEGPDGGRDAVAWSPTLTVESGADAGVGTAPQDDGAGMGSPLCNIGKTDCDPDQKACLYEVISGTSRSSTCEFGSNCDNKVSVPVQQAACRIVDSKPACSSQLGTKKAGDSCGQSSDCEAELECVGAAGAAGGICRHYCCDSACVGTGSFCDFEPVFGGTALVPVCTAGDSCKLLGQGCPDDQTCTVVNQSTGQTACVTFGTAGVGEQCMTQKCGADLACISGTCLQLCLSGYSCASGESCMSQTALGGVGFCEP
jgi:hypothetical protein